MKKNSKNVDREHSRRERQIMDVLFEAGEASAADVQERLPDAPGYTACRTLLRILEDKGLVQHREEGRRYIYSPTPSTRSEGQTALKRVVQVFFGGSLEEALTAHLSDPSAAIDDAELGRLRNVIDEAVREEQVKATRRKTKKAAKRDGRKGNS